MRIALLSPKGPLYRHRGGIFGKALRYAPLTLTTLAALVPPDLKAQVRIYDEGIEDIPDTLEADLVGMTVITGNAPRAYEVSDRLRSKGIPVVLGGPHITLVPDEALRHADAIVTGYAEESWPQLLNDFAAGRMRPRYDQRPGFKLDRPVFPARELLDARQYRTLDVFEATRSCSHNCDFCVAPTAWGRKPYQKPVEHVVEDIRRRGARKAIFVDLNLIADRRYAARLFEALIPLRFQWYGLSTIHIATEPELLELAVRSGCKGLLIGFETVSTDNLARLGKRFNSPQDYPAAVALLHRNGITVMGCFVFGLDSDTRDVFRNTAEFVIRAHIDLPRFAIATPFPGTPLHTRLAAEGRILERDWSLYDAQHVVFQPAGMSVDELTQGHQAAWRRTYSYGGMARRILGSRVQVPLSVAANLGYRYYAWHLDKFYTCDWIVPAAPHREAS